MSENQKGINPAVLNGGALIVVGVLLLEVVVTGMEVMVRRLLVTLR